jgi:hypothetical protein
VVVDAAAKIGFESDLFACVGLGFGERSEDGADGLAAVELRVVNGVLPGDMRSFQDDGCASGSKSSNVRGEAMG